MLVKMPKQMPISLVYPQKFSNFNFLFSKRFNEEDKAGNRRDVL